jgi:hypothetical protein
MVSLAALGSALGGGIPTSLARRVPQAASRGLARVPKSEVLAKASGEAVEEAAKTQGMPFLKKVAIGAGAIGGVAVLGTGALGRNCERLMGAENCKFITAPEEAVRTLTGLPAQLAEGVVFVTAGLFVIGTTLLTHNIVGNEWLTATAFVTSTFVAVGVVNHED